MARPGAGGMDESWEYSLRKYLLLLAMLVASVTYSAGFDPPGGVWHTAHPPAANHIASDPIIRDTNYARYLAFFYSNATAFASSLVVIVLVLILPVRHDNGAGRTLLPPLLGVLRAFIVLDLLSLMGAYAAAAALRDALTAVYSLVLSAGAVGYLVAHLVLASRSPAEEDKYRRGKSAPERLRRRKVLMVLVTLAASLTYQAGLTAPGGFCDHREDGHRPGDAILKGGPHDARLKAFFVCNTTAFVASLLILVMLLEKKLCFSQKVRSYEINGFIAVTIISLLAAYAAGSCWLTDDIINYVSSMVLPVAMHILIQVVAFVLRILYAKCSQHQAQQQTSANGNGSNEHQQTPDPQTSNEKNNGSDEHQQEAQVLQTSDDNNAGGEDEIKFFGSEQTDFTDQEGEMSATLGINEFPTSSSLGTMGPLLQKLDSLATLGAISNPHHAAGLVSNHFEYEIGSWLPPQAMPLKLLRQITNNFSERLGGGTFGTVYKGVLNNGKEVVVKLLHSMAQRFEIEENEFWKELENLRRLNHPNIVQLLGYCYRIEQECVEHEGRFIVADKITRALCLEYMHNTSLKGYLDDASVDWQTRYKIILGTCEGLHYLHNGLETPMLHLDLKPGNILLDQNMVPKLADFGLSKLIYDSKTQTASKFVGTRRYCPPEHFRGLKISRKFDIFSLGVVMIEIIAGSEGYNKAADEMPSHGFLDDVQENWIERIHQATTDCASPKCGCRQVKTCIKIALECVHPERMQRPNIEDILSRLNEIEHNTQKSATTASSQNEK